MNTNDAIKTDMLAYVNEKYEATFVADTLIKANWAYHYDKLYVYPEGEAENKFEIHRYQDEAGNISYADGYFGILIKNDYDRVVSDIVQAAIGEATVYTSLDQEIYANRLKPETKLSGIYHPDEIFSSQSFVFTTPSQLGSDQFSDEQLRVLGQKLADEKLVCFLTLYVISDDNYANLDEATFKNNLIKLNPSDRRMVEIDYSLAVAIKGSGTI
ncbi:hypothetical protein [Acetobacterium wieringae]|uniref:hypothetical protein n=1 Tax=Acetobacterium wieringae TaxID=52694 RepID=UPI0031581D34